MWATPGFTRKDPAWTIHITRPKRNNKTHRTHPLFSSVQVADVVALGLHVNKRPVGALTRIVRASKAQDIGRQMVEVLAEEMDRAVYDIIVSAAQRRTQK